jgi:membrane protein DedA with SNARE-associated domain
MHCVREICRTLYQYGVDLPAILGFLVGTFLTYFPGHRFVGALFERRRSIVKTRMEADLEKTLKRAAAYGLGSWLTFSPEYVRYYHLP